MFSYGTVQRHRETSSKEAKIYWFEILASNDLMDITILSTWFVPSSIDVVSLAGCDRPNSRYFSIKRILVQVRKHQTIAPRLLVIRVKVKSICCKKVLFLLLSPHVSVSSFGALVACLLSGDASALSARVSGCLSAVVTRQHCLCVMRMFGWTVW